MIIIYITDAFAVWGGTERVLADKINYLAEIFGYQITLITISQGNHPLSFKLHHAVNYTDIEIRMHQQYQYHGINRLFIRRKLKKLLKKRLKEVLDEIKPDIIICAKFDFVGVLMEVKGNARLIIESHTLCSAEYIDSSGWLRQMHIRTFKKNISKADVVIALTEGDAADWLKINPRVYVIPNIVHLNSGESYSRCAKKSAIYVGRFCDQKDIDSLLAIWQIVHQKHPYWTLQIYGEGELKKEYLSKIELIDANIQVYNPTLDIMSEYMQNSMLLLTSLYEPFGLVLPEAMSCGLPVVAFDCPYGPADIITDGVDGFLIKNRDIQAFADRVCQLIEDEELRCRMGQNGVVSSQRFRADKIMPRWINLFEKLLSSQ
jgi:glycosyltransferase involved in cell wall biosynthesis